MPSPRTLGLAVLAAVGVVSCKPAPPPLPPPTPSPSPSATPTPRPSPTPEPTPYVSRKPIEIGKIFNGITLVNKFETPKSGSPASLEREDDDSYKVEITLTAKLPRASVTLEDLAGNDPKLPHVLNQMPQLVANAKVSPYFEKLYENKIASLRERLNRLDLLLTRHNFFDCETILELKDPTTGRKALLMQGDMDVNTDGSDGDRNFAVDSSSPFFQPQTSYRWAKQTSRPNPTLPIFENRLAALKQEYASKGLPAERNRELKQAIDETNRLISDIKHGSFLISGADPSIVVPGFMLRDKSNSYSPVIGDYAVVIYDGKVYPAIVGDAGPSTKMGEASLRIAKEINPRSSGLSRAVSNVKVSYLIFPGSAEKPAPPDLALWREKCQALVDEMGGTAPELHTWENIVPPWPTPTPTPAPTPSPSPAAESGVAPQDGSLPVPSAELTPPPAPSPVVPQPTPSAPEVISPTGTSAP